MTAAILAGAGVVGVSSPAGEAALSHPRVTAGSALLASDGALGTTSIDPHALDLQTFGPQTFGPQTFDPEASGTGSLDRYVAGMLDTDGDDTVAWEDLPDRASAYEPRHSALLTRASVPASTVKASTTRANRPYARGRQRVRAVPPAAWVDPLPEARVTSCFGQRWGRLHAGVDLAAPNGTRIRAAGAGTVVAAGPAAGYGNAVLVDHGNGYLTHYGHMSVVTVRVGQRVAAAEQIGNEGSTGHSTGPHLHFEVHQGFYKNPIEPTGWMHAHGVDIAGCVPLTASTGSTRSPAPGHTAKSRHPSQNGRPSKSGHASTVSGRRHDRAPGAHRATVSDPTPTIGQQFTAQRHRTAHPSG